MSKTNVLETEDLTYWLTTAATITISRPTTGDWHIALFTDATSDAGGGTEVSDTVDDTAYTRIQENTAGFTVSGDSATNTDVITFPACVYGSGGVPYTVTNFAIFDHATAGNMLYHGALDSSKTVSVGDQVSFAIGDITVTED